jgi:hypothetical protein
MQREARNSRIVTLRISIIEFHIRSRIQAVEEEQKSASLHEETMNEQNDNYNLLTEPWISVLRINDKLPPVIQGADVSNRDLLNEIEGKRQNSVFCQRPLISEKPARL